jgi:hypothetical protein
MSEDPRTSDGPPRGDDSPPPAGGAEAPGSPSPAAPAVHLGREPGDLVIALSPRQIFGGFALLAGLILMLRRRGRGKG